MIGAPRKLVPPPGEALGSCPCASLDAASAARETDNMHRREFRHARARAARRQISEIRGKSGMSRGCGGYVLIR